MLEYCRCVDPVEEADCPVGTVLVQNKVLGRNIRLFRLYIVLKGQYQYHKRSMSTIYDPGRLI